MLSVVEAANRIVAAVTPLEPESIPLAHAAGRVLAEDTVAGFDHPPNSMSAMDGYAVRSEDAASIPVRLRVVGEAPAGRPFAGTLSAGQAVRIFTGGVVPRGADAIVIQENAAAQNGYVAVAVAPRPGQHIRVRGLDFRAGEILLPRGRRLSPRDIALLAAADFPRVSLVRKPRVAIAATGDELSRPGEDRGPGGIVVSSTYAISAMIDKWGGVAVDIGILPDRNEAFAHLHEAATGTDLILTQGGASVGDHDLVRTALAPHGFTLDFWKIAMRPGKPLIFGNLKGAPLIGLPGNPVSAMICAILFVRPAIAAMLGMTYKTSPIPARLASPLEANGSRQDYIRTRITRDEQGILAEPFPIQDSSMQKIFAAADGLIVRRIGAPPAAVGDVVDILLLDDC